MGNSTELAKPPMDEGPNGQKTVALGRVDATLLTREMPELLRDKSPEELQAMEKKLVRKIDIRLLPMLILIYIMNYLDRCVYLPRGLALRGNKS